MPPFFATSSDLGLIMKPLYAPKKDYLCMHQTSKGMP